MQKMENKYYKQSVQRLDFLSQEKIDNMKKNDIMTLGQLSNTKKSALNEIGFENSEIDRIFSELQLLDLGIAKNTLQSK
jgi:mevalonate kinase